MYGGEGLYSDAQSIMGSGHMGSPYEQTDACQTITFLQLCFRAVMIAHSADGHCSQCYFVHRYLNHA